MSLELSLISDETRLEAVGLSPIPVILQYGIQEPYLHVLPSWV